MVLPESAESLWVQGLLGASQVCSSFGPRAPDGPRPRGPRPRTSSLPGPPPGTLPASLPQHPLLLVSVLQGELSGDPRAAGPQGLPRTEGKTPGPTSGSQLPGGPRHLFSSKHGTTCAQDGLNPSDPGRTKTSFYLRPLKWRFEKSRKAFSFLALPLQLWCRETRRGGRPGPGPAKAPGAPTPALLTELTAGVSDTPQVRSKVGRDGRGGENLWEDEPIPTQLHFPLLNLKGAA